MVTLDGATGTELIDVLGTRPETEEHLWGVTAVIDAPDHVREVHRRYVQAGCDVLSTNTWGLATALTSGGPPAWDSARPVHWMDVARDAIRLARSAITTARSSDVAVAFSLNGDVDAEESRETIELLGRAFSEEPPDLILLETLSLVRPSTYATVGRLLETGLPVWLSFRRCRHGVCGIYGEHWGGPEGDAFGRAARRFEEMGVGALLVNCLPPDHVTGMVSWLRDFTDLPLGVYPNLGYLSSEGWRQPRVVDPEAYAEMAAEWRDEGAQIIGGCCGVGPEHIAATHDLLAESVTGTTRRDAVVRDEHPSAVEVPAWNDARGRSVFPVPFPDLVVDPDVAVPGPASLMLWKYLQRETVGAHQRCLEVGCGSGLQTVQLAQNGAAHVHAIDNDEVAVANTRNNAFRNGVSERISVAVADVYPWVPDERYDVIVANLDQAPVDPFGSVTSHRPLDYWGRNLVDHLIGLLPEALADDGVAYLVHFSIIGRRRTAELLDALGLQGRVVDFALVRHDDALDGEREQLRRVEQLSDAYHLTLGNVDVAVAYLLEITRKGGERTST